MGAVHRTPSPTGGLGVDLPPSHTRPSLLMVGMGRPGDPEAY